MTYYAWAPEVGAVYVLTSADGYRAVFNNSADPDYVGFLTDVTGLDSPEVRDSGAPLVQADGGYQGYNYYGRRPITMLGTVAGHADVATRNLRLSKLRRASNAMTADASLLWTGTDPGALSLYTPVRRQQPLRITNSANGGPWNKDFQLLLVSYFAPVFSNSISAPLTNLIPNPSFEYDTVGNTPAAWSGSAGGGATITVLQAQSGWASKGSNSCRLTASMAGGEAYAQTSWIPVTAGMPYSFRLDTNVLTRNAAGSVMNVYVTWLNAAGVVLSQQNFDATTALGLVSLTGTTIPAPPGAANAIVQVGFEGATGSGTSDMYFDGVIFTPGTAIPVYGDGNTTGWKWLGTAGNSPSQASAASVTAENVGDYPAYPLITIVGPTVNPLTITNTTTGGVIKFLGGYTVAAGHSIVIDVLNHIATLDGTTSVNAYIDFLNSTWPPLVTGNNTYSTSSGTLSLSFRSAWL